MPDFFKKAQDPISSYTHFWGAVVSAGAILCFAGLGFLRNDSIETILSCIAFGLSALGLYSASSYYHYIPMTHSHHTLFRKLDHSMIYVLIAGSYTPIVLHYLKPQEGTLFILVIWGIALFGILAKIAWLEAPRVLYTALYLIMGWSIVFYFPAFYEAIEPFCLFLIALGGISYTIGGIIYMIKKPNLSKAFGFHELFHCFILGGTLFHFIAVACYII